MKRLLILTSIILASITLFAQSEKYQSAMKKNIALLDSAFNNASLFVSLSNNFERIATSEKNQWLPYYYAAYCKVNYGFMQADVSQNDPIAATASQLISKADSLQPNNSEISCIKSMIASMQMMVNPQARFMQYGAVSQKAMAAAMLQDTTNPRPYMLKGQGLKYTPEAFGGGCKAAAIPLATAIIKYDAFKPATDLMPTWGKAYTQKLVSECEAVK